jgi:hypothetical protein
VKVLLAGWFSFEEMGATAGDLLVRDVAGGWFSCCSPRYLAARPLGVQDTRFSDRFPAGHGLLAFSTPEEYCWQGTA